MLDAAVLIPRRATEHVLRDLGMRCSEKEIPDPLAQWTGVQNRHAKPDGWWLTLGCFFEGGASPLNDYGELAAAREVTADSCTGAFCIADGRLLTIVRPNEPGESAIWVAATCSGLTVETRGSQGLRGRAKEISLTGNGWKMELIEVSRLFRHWEQKGFKAGHIEERFQTGQEASLIKAIADASTVSPSKPVDAAPVDAPSLGEGYAWPREERLGGLHRLLRQGQPTAATSLVDRELPVGDQVAALEAIDWVPRTVLAPILQATRDGTMGKLSTPELPDGRVGSPFPGVHIQLLLGGEASNPIHRYLWPSFSPSGELSLDRGEEIMHSWEPSDSLIVGYRADDPDGIGNAGTPPALLDRRAYLTNHRLVSVARRDPTGIEPSDERPWCASHYRWEWIYEVGIMRVIKFKRTGIRAKKIAIEDTEGFYVRLRLASEGIYEIRFPETGERTGALRDLVDRSVSLTGDSGSGREIGEAATSTNELMFATLIRNAVPISGVVPYSLPEQL
jgi:hypothetical protein